MEEADMKTRAWFWFRHLVGAACAAFMVYWVAEEPSNGERLACLAMCFMVWVHYVGVLIAHESK